MFKFYLTMLILALLGCLNITGAEQPKPLRTYLVRIQQIAATGEIAVSTNRTQNAVETQVTEGKEFFSYSIQNEETVLFRGTLEPVDNRETVKLEYYYRRTDSKGNPSGVVVAKGATTIKVSEQRFVGAIAAGGGLSESVTNANAFVITVKYFVDYIGLRYGNSGFSVRLVDENGKPVVGAKAGLCDETWMLASGTLISDEKGIVAVFDNREELPMSFFVAEHKERDLFAIASLDRSQGDKPYVVVLKKGQKRPAGFERERKLGWK